MKGGGALVRGLRNAPKRRCRRSPERPWDEMFVCREGMGNMGDHKGRPYGAGQELRQTDLIRSSLLCTPVSTCALTKQAHVLHKWRQVRPEHVVVLW